MSNKRGCSQEQWHRSYHTFNFGTYFYEHRKPFGNLQVLNDDTLKGSFTVKHQIQEDSLILLLPIVGACDFKSSLGIKRTIDVGQSHIFQAPKGSEFEISNPYNDELINYLHIGLTADRVLSNANPIVEFDLDNAKTSLYRFAHTGKQVVSRMCQSILEI